ncbi:MAG: DUF1566 domain-containing protein [Dysgonamonadaceae bacterium]|jgi:hypothetical protein|nr:DUF1566 domain-containing protein [Dysgonamonadaceae bacterium]
MTKKTFFLLLLFLMTLGTVNVNAQVTIGSKQNPQDGAVLDLSQVNDQNLGFLLPRVSLVNVTDWQLQGDSNNGTGMLVYNTNAATAGGNGKAGMYIWTGAGGWEALKSNFADAVPVEGFDLSPSSPVYLYVGQTATVTVSGFMPYNARYPGVYWTISEGQDKTRITTRSMTSCILTGLALGQSTLTVTSLDGNYQQMVTIDIKACSSQPDAPTGITFSKTGIKSNEEITATATPEVTSGGTVPAKYNWTIPSDYFDITGGNGTRVITLSAKTASTSITNAIKVNAENTCGTSTDYSNTTVLSICTDEPATPETISFSPSSVDLNGTFTASVPEVSTGTQIPTSYTWTIPAGLTPTGSQTTLVPTIELTGTRAGKYDAGTIKVKATNACGTSDEQTSASAVTVCSAAPATPGAITLSSTSISQYSMFTASVREVTTGTQIPTSYTWTIPDGLTPTGSQTTTTTPTITLTGATDGTHVAGTIKVTANNDCGSSDERSSDSDVTVSPVDCSGHFLAQGAYSGQDDPPLSFMATMSDLTHFFQADGNLCIAKNDMEYGRSYQSWQDAKDACESLNTNDQSGWRLPNIAELGNLTSHKEEFSLSDQQYASSSSNGYDTSFLWYFYMNWVTTASGEYYSAAVRCVKSL